MSSKPILFNTEMVKAILDGRKTQFRIPVNVSSDCTYYASGINKTAISSNFNNCEAIFVLPKDKWKNSLTPKLGYFSSCYKDGDIIFVQEDWKVGGWNNTSFAFSTINKSTKEMFDAAFEYFSIGYLRQQLGKKHLLYLLHSKLIK